MPVYLRWTHRVCFDLSWPVPTDATHINQGYIGNINIQQCQQDSNFHYFKDVSLTNRMQLEY